MKFKKKFALLFFLSLGKSQEIKNEKTCLMGYVEDKAREKSCGKNPEILTGNTVADKLLPFLRNDAPCYFEDGFEPKALGRPGLKSK